MTTILNDAHWAALLDIQDACRQNSIAKGFAEDYHELVEVAKKLKLEGNEHLADLIIRNYFGNRMFLIAGEAVEAHEQLRAGRDLAEAWYSGSKDSPYNEHESLNNDGTPRKPEGIPSELADILIRVLDLAAELGIDLAAATLEKFTYNATRAKMHGGKLFG